MNCSRCRGLMAKDHFMDFDGTAGHMWMSGWRCLNCGHIYDPVIEQNRRMPQVVVQTVSDDRPVDSHEDVLDGIYAETDSYLDHAA